MAKKYYWIKLKTDFFNSNEIDFLMSQENGCQYVVLYQMLCLNTANNNGEMATRIGEMIVPYNAEKIVRDTKYFNFDTVTVALGLFKKLGLIYEEEGQVLRIANYDDMVGSETSKAEIMRRKRAKDKELASGNIVTQMLPETSNIVTEEKEIRDKSKSKENKSKDIDIYYENQELNSLFIEFLEVRKKLKAVNSERAINTLLKTLSEYDDNTKYKMIETSIVNSWKSVYPLKKDKPNASNTYKRQEIVPDWLNKEIKDTTTTAEEQAELEDLLAEYKDPDFEERKTKLQARLKEKYKKQRA